MSTRSTISYLSTDDKISTVYCHSDGYLSYNGALLYINYQSPEKVKELISFGDMSSLDKNISPKVGEKHGFNYSERAKDVCVFYARDRGESDVEARVFNSFEDYKNNNSFEQYNYIYKEKNKTWYLYNTNTNKMQLLSGLLKKHKENDSELASALDAEKLAKSVKKEKKVINTVLKDNVIKATPKIKI